MEKIRISPSCTIEDRMVAISVFIDLSEVKLLRGLNSLNVRIPDTLLMKGNIDIKLVITTMKSSQFHASFKYAPFSNMNPHAIIFNIASKVNTDVKNGSVVLTIRLRIESESGFS